jgi:NADPH2:quinone reductase
VAGASQDLNLRRERWPESCVDKPGGVEELKALERDLPKPGAGEVLIRQTAIGVNFLDIYHRTGLYPLPAPSCALGVEGAGIVESLGPGVSTLQVGQRVAYAGAPIGAYASERLLPAARAIPLPPNIPDEIAATAMITGLTAHMLLLRTYVVTRGTMVLVHAAAGGVGSFVTKWAKRLGAVVFATVGSEAKAAIAKENGADHVIVGRGADFTRRVLKLTHNRGVDVAYDGVGGTTLQKTIECVRRFGTVVSIGQAGGPIPLLDIEHLGPARALVLARPSVMAYSSEPETYRQAAADLLQVLQDGLIPNIGRSYPLAEVAHAHADLESGRTVGSIYLVP